MAFDSATRRLLLLTLAIALAPLLLQLPGQVALAWLLRRSPVMLPIPGTGKVRHLEENTAAAGLSLTDEDFRALDEVGKQEWQAQQK